MLGLIVPAVLSAAALVSACTIPGGTLSNNITQGFAIQVQNKDYPVIHNRLMNLWEAGGGDKHLYLSPAGDAASDLTLVNGVITRGIIHAVINGEYTASDNTTKTFMTERGDPKAYYDVKYGCNPDTDAVQTQLSFKSRDTLLGGFICVRTASGDRYEFRYSPPGNQVVDSTRPCIPITMAVIHP